LLLQDDIFDETDLIRAHQERTRDKGGKSVFLPNTPLARSGSWDLAATPGPLVVMRRHDNVQSEYSTGSLLRKAHSKGTKKKQPTPRHASFSVPINHSEPEEKEKEDEPLLRKS